MKIGFTGTSEGMTAQQLKAFRAIIFGMDGKFHHGDCVGADAQAAEEIELCSGMATVAHPPDIDRKRAFFPSHEWRNPKPYLERNRDIVNETEVLVAAPLTTMEVQRSGTWSTIRYARRLGRKIHIIQPSGIVVTEGGEDVL